jgi:hypothetical protein
MVLAGQSLGVGDREVADNLAGSAEQFRQILLSRSELVWWRDSMEEK